MSSQLKRSLSLPQFGSPAYKLKRFSCFLCPSLRPRPPGADPEASAEDMQAQNRYNAAFAMAVAGWAKATMRRRLTKRAKRGGVSSGRVAR